MKSVNLPCLRSTRLVGSSYLQQTRSDFCHFRPTRRVNLRPAVTALFIPLCMLVMAGPLVMEFHEMPALIPFLKTHVTILPFLKTHVSILPFHETCVSILLFHKTCVSIPSRLLSNAQRLSEILISILSGTSLKMWQSTRLMLM
ncbi:hypothetical protein H4Q26_000846 [Puccinia striiformis f. sp. tritici PST-130]|nr:hypothetical protein H4Q26_000846 [Puccinia striiformis f. sp. tritici PST-130]